MNIQNILSDKYNNNNYNNYNNFNETQNIQIKKNMNENQNYLSSNNKNLINNNINLNNVQDIPKINGNHTDFIEKSRINTNINFKSLDNNNFISENFKSIQKKYKPLFSKSINKKYILSHNIHIKNKNKYELNKILLQSQNFIKNHKYIPAYYLLRNTISAGEYHSDLFYLYGEVNRLLKNYEDAEDYLLLALNF